MALTVNDFRLINSDYAYAKKVRFTLGHLFGLGSPSCLPELLLQGSKEEVDVVLRLLGAFAETKTQNQRLRDIAEKGLHEYELEVAFAAGRDYAIKQPIQMLQEHGLEWRYTKNPYKTDGQTPDTQKYDAWSDGFKSHFDVACCEAW